MNAGNVIKLNKWINQSKQRIVSENKTLAERSEEAAKALGFKVSSNSMSAVLRENGIETRRQSPTQVKIAQLEQEKELYRQWLRRCVDTVAVQDWMLEEMSKAFQNDAEMSQAIKAKKSKTK